VKRLGILALAEPDNGGVFQYTQAMLEALCILPGWQKTIYQPLGTDYYAKFQLPTRGLVSTKRRSVALSLMDKFFVPAVDPFRDEDVVISTIYSPYLLHTRTPFAYTLHDLQERYLPANFSLSQRIWRGFIQPRIARRATRVICESTFVRNDIVQFFGMPESKVAVIPAPPLWQMQPTVDEAGTIAVRAKYSLPPQFLFYPAQFWPHKNHARLLDAFARIAPEFPGVDLVFTGHRRFEYPGIQKQIERLGLTNRVHLLGYVDSCDVPVLYRLSTALVMPSLFESISIPIYEAFRTGTPVCASSVLAMKEQVGDAGVTFDPYSVESMAGAIKKILSDQDLRKLVVQRGQEKLAMMTSERYASQLGDLLEQVRAQGS
jgi:glycosyltransferase involved in cell wall biosynthesis